MHLFRRWIKLLEDAMPLAQEMIEAFEDAFDKSPLKDHVSVSLWYSKPWPPDHVELSSIDTKPDSRRQGYASQAMAMICEFADKYQVILTLGVAEDADGEDDTLTADQLHDWYTSWGFEGGMSMKRYPDDYEFKS